jgi:hypothetical protein
MESDSAPSRFAPSHAFNEHDSTRANRTESVERARSHNPDIVPSPGTRSARSEAYPTPR